MKAAEKLATAILGQAEDEIDLVRLAPTHQGVTCEARVGLVATEHQHKTIDSSGRPSPEIVSHIGFPAVATEASCMAPRQVSAEDRRPPYPTQATLRSRALSNCPHDGAAAVVQPTQRGVPAT